LNADGAKALSSLHHPELKGLLEEQKIAGFALATNSLAPLCEFSNAPVELDETSVQPGIVDRVRLREFLTHGIEENIKWNKRLERYEENNEKVIAYFDDGTQAEADLLVAADGANSRVRAQRCPSLSYDEVNCSTGFSTIPLPSADVIPKITKLTQDNMLRVFGPNGHAILIMRYKKLTGEEMIWWTMSHPRETFKPKSEQEHLQHYIEKGKMFHPEIQYLINSSPKLMLSYDYKSMNNFHGNVLGNTSRVTLIGDAAHATTSHAGLGANTAFQDAIDLADAIKKEGDWKKNVEEYEKTMIKRGEKVIKFSTGSTSMMHSTNMFTVAFKYVMFYTMGTIISIKKKLCW
jgi:2-polyprenyl-6-methoxyphenol hydroxylase-like FAD-dependent oxidoreductase